jgi:hypothetical protein
MRGLWAALVLIAGTAAADPYCKPDAAALAALPGMLAGDWQGALLQGVVVQGGLPSLMPVEGAAVTHASLAVGAAGVIYSDSTVPSGIDLPANATSDDFALPGESALSAEELLAPMMGESHCALVDMAQYQGATLPKDGITWRFHVFVVSDSEWLMVVHMDEGGLLVKPNAMAVRAVLRYARQGQ